MFFAFAPFSNMIGNFPSLPLSHFCTSPSDPCTCTGGPYRIYRPLCTFRDMSTEAQAALVNSNATAYLLPDLPREYVKTITTNGSTAYAIDLDFLEAEQPTLFSIVSARNQELVYAGFVTLALVVGGMLFAEAGISRWAKETVREVQRKVSFHATRSLSNLGNSFASRSSPSAAEEEKDD